MRILPVIAVLSVLSVPAVAQVPKSTAETKSRIAAQDVSAQSTIVPMRICEANLTNISCNTTVSDSLSPASCYADAARGRFYVDGYKFSIASTVNIDVRLSSLMFDATLVVFNDATGKPVYDDNDSGGGTNARVRGTLYPGTYSMGVTTAQPYQTGGYTLTFSCFSAASCISTPIQCGANFTDTIRNTSCQLGDGSYYAVYSFEGVAGSTVTIDMTSTSVDPYLFLLPPSGNDFQDNNSGGGSAAKIQTTLPLTGRYFILANGYQADSVGSFNLRFSCQSAPTTSPCIPGPSVLCLDDSPGDRRYRVDVKYQTTQGAGAFGDGKAIQTNSLGVSRGGLFWFFAPDNPELLIKVLDGCGINGRKWVFYSAGTNVGMDIKVTDMRTGAMKTYLNPDRQVASSVQDANALPCP